MAAELLLIQQMLEDQKRRLDENGESEARTPTGPTPIYQSGGQALCVSYAMPTTLYVSMESRQIPRPYIIEEPRRGWFARFWRWLRGLL